MKSVIIQDTWNEPEDEELIDYCKKNFNLKILNKKEILQIKNPLKNFEAIFADTKIMKKILKINVENYPICFEKLYKRKIEKIKIDQIENFDCSIFVKPLGNDKIFDGFILNPKNKYDKQYLYEKQKEYNFSEIYISEVVEFVNEYRLFIFNYEIHGIIESSKYVLEKFISSFPPETFLKQICFFNKIPCCVIDIGMKKNGEFAIVEVNPPFSLSSYDYPIEKYIDYQIKVFKLSIHHTTIDNLEDYTFH